MRRGTYTENTQDACLELNAVCVTVAKINFYFDIICRFIFRDLNKEEVCLFLFWEQSDTLSLISLCETNSQIKACEEHLRRTIIGCLVFILYLRVSFFFCFHQ